MDKIYFDLNLEQAKFDTIQYTVHTCKIKFQQKKKQTKKKSD